MVLVLFSKMSQLFDESETRLPNNLSTHGTVKQ